MEILTGFIIAGFIYYSGYLVMENKIGINNFFSFLAAMMLAYQPIRSLASINIVVNQGFAAAKRIFEIIDTKIHIKEEENSKNLTIKDASISFKNVNFSYPSSDQHAVKNIDLKIIEIKDLEIGIYNWSIDFANKKQVTKNWDNEQFKQIYINVSN